VMRRTFWRHGPPCVMTMHGLEERWVYAMRREAKKGRAWHFRWKNRLWHRIHHQPQYNIAIRTADQSIVLNREAWSFLQLKYNREESAVSCIPNGVEGRFFIPREYPAKIAPRLLTVGSWLDRKGVYYLRDAMRILVHRYPELRLTVAGCSVTEQTIREFFGPELQSHVDVIPHIPSEEMPAIYAASDVLVFPSLVEGLPLALLEAMATGMPVVTTETCGMVDVVQDQVTGLLVLPADAQAIAEAVMQFTDSLDLRCRLGHAARTSMKNYTWDRMAARVEKIFARAVKNGSSRASREAKRQT
jgi:glycosyltransferase involved in cell wall biosynthesis